MGNVICPLSNQKVDQHTIRLTGFCMALCIAIYLKTSNILPMVAITIDYGLRAFTSGKLSPFATISSTICSSTVFKLQSKLINKAPKIFASRVGFLFASTSTILYLKGYVLESQYVAGTLMIFALLESLGNFCFGCVVYQYMILPIFGPSTATTDNNNNNNSNDNKSK